MYLPNSIFMTVSGEHYPDRIIFSFFFHRIVVPILYFPVWPADGA